MSDSDLRAKYGAGACDAGHQIQPQTFARRLAQRDSLDQNFTQLWLDFAISGMSRRPALDTRTRLLVLIGQYTMAKSHAALEDTVRAALAAGVKSREILEIICSAWSTAGTRRLSRQSRCFIAWRRSWACLKSCGPRSFRATEMTARVPMRKSV